MIVDPSDLDFKKRFIAFTCCSGFRTMLPSFREDKSFSYNTIDRTRHLAIPIIITINTDLVYG